MIKIDPGLQKQMTTTLKTDQVNTIYKADLGAQINSTPEAEHNKSK